MVVSFNLKDTSTSTTKTYYCNLEDFYKILKVLVKFGATFEEISISTDNPDLWKMLELKSISESFNIWGG